MLHILLTTLKVLGILLAITLGLIISLILIVLFVPIRYKADVQNTNVRGKVTWILHLVTINLEFIDKVFKYKIKILGITINTDKKKKQKDKKPKKTSQKQDKSENKKTEIKKIEPEQTKVDKPKEESKIETNTGEDVIVEKKSISQKLSDVINNIKFKIKSIYDKIKEIITKISDYKDFLTTDEAKANIKDILKIVFDLLVYILPTKIKGNVKFGMEDPESTGKALGVICMFYGLYGEKVDIIPDFENKVFEADLHFKGRIRLYKVLIAAYKLWKNEWIKKLLKFTKTH